MKRFPVLIVLVAAVAACGGGTDGVQIADVRVGEPTGPNAAVYFTATSDTADRLVGVETDVAASVQIHETTVGDDGTMGMQPVESLEVSEGDSLVLEPGGLHLMLIDVERLEVGDEIDVVLVWESAGEMTVRATVVAPDEVMGHEDHDG